MISPYDSNTPLDCFLVLITDCVYPDDNNDGGGSGGEKEDASADSTSSSWRRRSATSNAVLEEVNPRPSLFGYVAAARVADKIDVVHVTYEAWYKLKTSCFGCLKPARQK